MTSDFQGLESDEIFIVCTVDAVGKSKEAIRERELCLGYLPSLTVRRIRYSLEVLCKEQGSQGWMRAFG